MEAPGNSETSETISQCTRPAFPELNIYFQSVLLAAVTDKNVELYISADSLSHFLHTQPDS